MKRFLILILAICLAVACFATGCAGEQNDTGTTKPANNGTGATGDPGTSDPDSTGNGGDATTPSDGIELPEEPIEPGDGTEPAPSGTEGPTTPSNSDSTDPTGSTDESGATNPSNGGTTPDVPVGPEDGNETNPTDPTEPSGTTGTTPSQPDNDEQVYGITYEGLMGATHSNPSTYTASTAAGIVLTPPSAVDGYTFDGWYINNVKVTSLAGYQGNLTVTAKWTKNSSGAIELPDVDF